MGDHARGAHPPVDRAAQRLLRRHPEQARLPRHQHRHLRADQPPGRLPARLGGRGRRQRHPLLPGRPRGRRQLPLRLPDRPGQARGAPHRRSAEPEAGGARARPGRHLHRRTRRGPAQDGLPAPRGRRRRHHRDAHHQARHWTRTTSSTRARSSRSEPGTSSTQGSQRSGARGSDRCAARKWRCTLFSSVTPLQAVP